MCRQGGRARGGWLPVCVRALALRWTLRLVPQHGAAVSAVAAWLGSSITLCLSMLLTPPWQERDYQFTMEQRFGGKYGGWVGL